MNTKPYRSLVFTSAAKGHKARKEDMFMDKELFGDTQMYREIATASCRNLAKTRLLPAKYSIKRISAAFESIRRQHDALCKRDNTEMSALPEWLANNFRLIEKEYKLCKKELCTRARIPFLNGIPRITAAFENFANHADFPHNAGSITTVISVLDESFGLLTDELFLLPNLVKCAFIAVIENLICEYAEKKLSDLPVDEDKYLRRLCDIMESLKSASVHNYNADILGCRCARILSDDPAGAFDKMTDASKMLYLRLLSQKARRLGITETECAENLIKCAEKGTDERTRHIGNQLICYPRTRKYLYFTFVLAFPLVLTLVLLALSPLFLLAFLPLWEASVKIADFVFSRVVKTIPLSGIELSEIPKEASVLVVITSLLYGEESDAELFDRLECIFCANNERNVYFGVLADIREYKSANAPGDEKTINYAYGRTEALCAKYGKKFILFERSRSYSKSEEVFMGRERRRGAIVELVKFLKGENSGFTEKSQALAQEVLKNTRIKYVITLDRDTNPELGAVRDMCSIMMHPLAKPYVDKDKGIVTKGYGILQPKCVTGLYASSATPFASVMCGKEESNAYPCTAFNAYQDIFGEGIFCGNGIFDADAFYEVIIANNTFPEDRILSHAILEGAKLGCGLVSEVELTDGFPKNQISYIKKLHRQIRGDVANLAYLFPKITFPEDVRRNTISALSKYKLLAKVSEALVPLFSYVCIFCAMVSTGKVKNLLIAAGLFYILLPFLCSLCSMFSNIATSLFTRQFFAKGVTSGVRHSFFGMLFVLSMLPVLAFVSLDAVLKTLYRMLISKKKLLCRQTSESADRVGNGLLLYVQRNMICVFSGFVLLVFSPAGFLRLIALLWFAFPVVAYHASAEKSHKAPTREKDVYLEKSKQYALDIWHFFADTVGAFDNFLPMHSISLAPLNAAVHITTPESIGFYLLSVLCAADFGFITASELEERLRSTLGTIEKMERYKGHFFSRYDTKTLDVLSPRYISSADSGNFIACLITLRMGLRDYVSESTSLLEVIKCIQDIEQSTDYSFLYNKDRQLLSIGAKISDDGKASVSSDCHSHVISEAQVISYILCAKREVSKKHRSSLSRPLVSSDGYIGLCSRNGTAYEYFMPHIFLPLHKGSLYGKATEFALHEQSKENAKRYGKSIFGISESSFYAFDLQMNYRYRIFGVPKLSENEYSDKDLVISPYSSFLGLCVDKRKIFANLFAMEKAGLYGKYGFYEAIDFSPERSTKNGSVVKSYMSHHLGMSLCALCNCAFDNILQKRFMSDSVMNCAGELLKEIIPVNAPICKRKKAENPLSV